MAQSVRKFVHIGMGTIVNKDHIDFAVVPNTATAKKFIELTNKIGKGMVYNATVGHRCRTLIILDDGRVIKCILSPPTLLKRLNADGPVEKNEDDMVDIDADDDEGTDEGDDSEEGEDE